VGEMHQYELSEPVGRRVERFNWWAALFTYLWAAGHGMWDWAAGLYLASALAALLPAGVWPEGFYVIAIPGEVVISYYFGRRANRLLWQRDQARFYRDHRVRPAVPLKERIVVSALFAPFALLYLGLAALAMGWIRF